MRHDIRRLFIFNSNTKFYDKERHGIKPNTVREIDLNDARFIELIHWMDEGWNDGDIKIQINDAGRLGHSFQRDIVDISIYNTLMIISWKHKKDVES